MLPPTAGRSSMIGIGNGIEQGTDAMPYAIAYPRLPIKSVGCATPMCFCASGMCPPRACSRSGKHRSPGIDASPKGFSRDTCGTRDVHMHGSVLRVKSGLHALGEQPSWLLSKHWSLSRCLQMDYEPMCRKLISRNRHARDARLLYGSVWFAHFFTVRSCSFAFCRASAIHGKVSMGHVVCLGVGSADAAH